MRIRNNPKDQRWLEMTDRAEALTRVLRRETLVRTARKEAEANIVSAERAILESNDEDSTVEGFVNWLPQARKAIERASLAEREVGIDVAVAYQAFILARNVAECCSREEKNEGLEAQNVSAASDSNPPEA